MAEDDHFSLDMIFEEPLSEVDIFGSLLLLFQTEEDKRLEEEEKRLEEEERRRFLDQLLERNRIDEEERRQNEELRRLEQEKEHERLSRLCHYCGDREATEELSHISLNGDVEEQTNHKFCFDCLRECLQYHAKNQRRSVCFYCRESVPFSFFQQWKDRELLSKEDFDKYEENVSLNFIHVSGTLRFCPKPTCSFGFTIDFCEGSSEANSSCLIDCPSCSHRFCGRCGESNDVHENKTCSQVQTDVDLWRDEREQLGEEEQKIKKCPQCRSTLEKNEGCIHMTCPCGHQFCWLCLADWITHETCELQLRLEEERRVRERIRREEMARERERRRQEERERRERREREREQRRQAKLQQKKDFKQQRCDQPPLELEEVELGALFAF